MTDSPVRGILAVSGNKSEGGLASAIETHALYVALDLDDVRNYDLSYVHAAIVILDTGLALFTYDASATAPDDGVAGVHDENGRVFARDQLPPTVSPVTLVRSASGAESQAGLLEEELTLAGASVDSTIEIPAGAIVYAVSERVTEVVTGATSFKVGTAADDDKFGDTLALTLGSTNRGLIGPDPFYAATAIRVTANGSDFTGGKVRIAIHFTMIEPPEE